MTDPSQAQIDAVAARLSSHSNLSDQTKKVRQALDVIYGPGPPVDTPLVIYGSASVSEDDSNGAVVASVTGTEGLDAPLTYSLADDAGGRFEINSSTGQITVANATLIVFATNQNHEVTVQTADTFSVTFTQSLTINVLEAPGPSFTISLDANTIADTDSSGTTIGALSASTDAVAPVAWSFDSNPDSIFALSSTSGLVTLADPTQIDAGVAASHQVTVRGVDDNSNAETKDLSIVVAGQVQMLDSGTIASTALSTSSLSGTITLQAGVNRKLVFTAFAEDDLPTLTSPTMTFNSTDVTMQATPAPVEESQFSLGLAGALGYYDVPDATTAGSYATQVSFGEAAARGGIFSYWQARAAKAGVLSNLDTVRSDVDSSSVTHSNYTTDQNGAAVLSAVGINIHDRTFTHNAAATESWDTSPGSPSIAASGSEETRGTAGSGSVSHQFRNATDTEDANAGRIISFCGNVPPFKEGPAISPAPSGQVVTATAITPEAWEEAYAQVTENDATIVFPAGVGVWSRGVSIPSGGFRVHTRGADWSPASTLYLTATTASQASQAADDFEPSTKITTVGISGTEGRTLFTCNVQGCIFSRLYMEGRRDTGGGTQRNDGGIDLNDQTDTVIYYCRFHDLDNEGVAFGGAMARCLLTDCVASTSGDGDGFAISRGNSEVVWDAYDIDTIAGSADQPYIQRTLFLDSGHAVDWSRNSLGVMRDCRVFGGQGGVAQCRVHGYYLFNNSQQTSARWYEIYRNYFAAGPGGSEAWTAIQAAGGSGVIWDNTVLDYNRFCVISYESISREDKHPENVDCSERSYPEKQQTTGLYFSNNTRNGVAVDGTDDLTFNQCGDEPGVLYQAGRDLFFTQRPGYTALGDHPLMPSEIP